MNINDVWTIKYSPKTLEEVLLSPEDAEYFTKLENIPHNFLFTGRPGSGKSTVAKLLAQKFSPNSYLYVNASEEGTIDTLREKIRGFIEVASFDGTGKIVILDEICGSSTAMQNGLRVILEEYLDDVKFILTANYRSKVIEAVRSRCKEFTFSSTEKDIISRIVYILKAEQISVDKESTVHLKALIKKYFPDIRKTLNELQACCITGKFIYKYNSDNSIAETIKLRLKAKEDVYEIRKFVVNNTDKFENDYHELMKILFDLYVKECNTVAVLLISEYMYRHAFVADTEINFSALLFNLGQKL